MSASATLNTTLLNLDVLLLVFALTNEQTKLALMSTCKELYREGGKQLLKSADVSVRTKARLRSFLRFMDADGGSRMRFLRRVSLNSGLEKPSKSLAVKLKKMLTRLAPVSRLTDLTICYSEALLSTHPPLCKAIADLTSLKAVDFTRAGKLSRMTLKSMQSKLETVGISFTRSEDGVVVDAVMLLRPFSSSLRVLSLADGAITTDPQDDYPQYPLLSQLVVNESTPLITWHYARAFPNLSSLTIMTMDGLDKAETEFPDIREENIAQLRRHGCWDSLDVFDGEIFTLWLLGLPCPVADLRLRDDGLLTPDMLRDVLGAARATKLYISFHQFSIFLDEEFIRAFAEGCGATLKALDLRLEISSDEYAIEGDDLDLGDVLNAVMDMLGSFSALESVALCIYFEGSNFKTEGERIPGEVFAEEMDTDAMCAALHAAVPSAKHVRFTLSDHWKRGTVTVEIGSEGGDKERHEQPAMYS